MSESIKLLGLLLIALAVRLWLLTGFYGSDDFVYADAVAHILKGDWRPFGYIGSVRFGFNIPIALCIWLLGASEYVYTLYPLLCSIVNILLVWRLGVLLFSDRIGLYAAFFMALCPLDVIWSGRIQPDAPLMMWMSASVYCFIAAGAAKGVFVKAGWLYFLAGLCLAIAYTTKNAALFLVPLFVYRVLSRPSNLRGMLPFVLGFLIVFGGEALFFWKQTGDPFYAFTLQAEFNRRVVEDGSEFTTSVLAYPYWAFFTLQHTGVMCYFALGSYVLFVINGRREPKATNANLLLIAIWLLSVFGLLTFYVMSWHPFKLIWKQPNYMLMFMAPIALLIGNFVQALNQRVRSIAFVLFALTSLFFASVEREVLAAESYNARVTAEFYRSHAEQESLYCGARDCGMVTMFMQFHNRDRLVPYDNPYRNAEHVVNLSTVVSGYVSINTRWLRRSWGSISRDNQQLLSSPPSTWSLRLESIHRPWGIIAFGDMTLSYLVRRGWIPAGWARSQQARIHDAIFPGPVRIYKVNP